MKKICLVGVHGVGKSKICEKVLKSIVVKNFSDKNNNITQNYGLSFPVEEFTVNDYSYYENALNLKFIPEQFREVVKDVPSFTKQTE